MSNNTALPIAVIGAGPIGLAAAANIAARNETPLVFEASDDVAGHIQQWAHVHVFSPWKYNVDAAAVTLLEKEGWQLLEPDALPTGGQLIEQYLRPLANTPELKPHIHFNARVTGVSRRRIDKLKDTGRDDAPFVLQVDVNGEPKRFLARAVIDASGVWSTPNPLGSDGLTAPGEQAFADKIHYGIPDILGRHLTQYADKTVAVIGGGHSAINAVLELGDLQQARPQTKIHWILRKAQVQDAYGGAEQDALPGRGSLGVRIREMVEAGQVVVHTPFYITHLEDEAGKVRLIGDTTQGSDRVVVDEIIAATGARPDLSFLRELRLSLDSSVESPATLAPLIDPNLHSCGTVPPHGEAELRQPEPNFYIVGNKSYGRAPTFLLATGYEQVRSVVAALAGDWEAAQDVQLNLPETGVCGVSVVDANAVEVACCTPSSGTDEAACCAPISQSEVLAESRFVPAEELLVVSTSTKDRCC
ncbi:MAG: NAD(P)-binding domain-containing protein [Chloroflexota bacterium]